jgi:hypothetical protein
MAIGEPPLAALDNAKKTDLPVQALPPKNIVP